VRPVRTRAGSVLRITAAAVVSLTAGGGVSSVALLALVTLSAFELIVASPSVAETDCFTLAISDREGLPEHGTFGDSRFGRGGGRPGNLCD